MDATTHRIRALSWWTVALLLSAAGPAFGQAPVLPPTPAVPPQRVRVADVVVQGNELIATPTVLSYVRTRPGTEYNPDTAQEDVRALVASKQFADVRGQVENLPGGSVRVYFVVRELPSTVRRVEYRGAKHLTDDELEALTRLRTGTPLNPTTNRLACQAIIRKYNDLGRPYADCYLLRGGKAGDTEVIFHITEGPKVQISDIRFTGNTFVGGEVLATHIQSSKKVFGLGGDYNAALIEADVGSLREYYRSFGYHDVAVSWEARHLPDGRNAVVVFHINEGARYRLKDTPTVVGSRRVPKQSELEEVLKLKARDWYDGRQMKRGEDEIRDWYGYQGIDARVQAVPYFSKDEPGLVTVRFEVDEGGPARRGVVP
jgi:outer membrane protein insertion porin family